MAIYIVILMLIVAVDQISKLMITSFFSLGQEKSIIKGILSFTYVRNEGAAFGMLQGARIFFIVLTIVVIIAAVWYIIKMRPQSPMEKTALAFIGGGAIGNFIDRALWGYVRDFIMTDFIDFPVFNIADCFVCIGAGLYIVYVLLDFSQSKNKVN